jgi:hypothetical protein
MHHQQPTSRGKFYALAVIIPKLRPLCEAPAVPLVIRLDGNHIQSENGLNVQSVKRIDPW